jgi:uncharacterized membrane protein
MMRHSLRARLGKLWGDIHSSLWFVPTLIVVGVIGLAIALIAVDEWIDDEVYESWPRLFGAGPQGARAMLGAIATSAMTVAGVAFSITIVALTLASSQYTSRILRTFLQDRANQAVLGLLVSVFAYCLIVLRTIREAPDGGFVPPLAVLGAVVLALVAVGALIFFIHHIAISLQVSHILAAVGAETMRAVDRLFHESLGENDEDSTATSPTADLADRHWRVIPARETGYIQRVDAEGLLRFADTHDVVIRMERGIGEFVIEGTPLVSLAGDGHVPTDAADRLNALYARGRNRTVDQDPGFGIQQIVDVAVKALSPGVNDTTTAVLCLEYLTAVLVRLADRRIESPNRYKDGRLRVIVRGPTFESFVNTSLDPIRQNAGGNVVVLRQLLRSLETISMASSCTRRRILAEQLASIAEVVRCTIESPKDRGELEDYSRTVAQFVDGPARV